MVPWRWYSLVLQTSSHVSPSLFQMSHPPWNNQGERRSVDACNKLGEFTITGVERARKGEPKVRICLTHSRRSCRLCLQYICFTSSTAFHTRSHTVPSRTVVDVVYRSRCDLFVLGARSELWLFQKGSRPPIIRTSLCFVTSQALDFFRSAWP